jgi:arabinose-5-phosphate isomerase
MHPGEAYHGDLGMIEKSDIVLAMSNSGQTDEVLKLFPYLENNGNVVISMTGDPESTQARHSHFHLNVAVPEEACPLSLAPTASTTAMLAMGDALAIALMNERDFRSEDYARFHPGGSLGRRLLTRVRDVMRRENLPCVPPEAKLSEVIIRISDARLGVAIITEEDKISGIVTDGDVRRAMQRYGDRFFDLPVSEVMTRSPRTVAEDARITEAEEIMHRHKIHSLLAVDEAGRLSGIVELYDLMRGN